MLGPTSEGQQPIPEAYASLPSTPTPRPRLWDPLPWTLRTGNEGLELSDHWSALTTGSAPKAPMPGHCSVQVSRKHYFLRVAKAGDASGASFSQFALATGLGPALMSLLRYLRPILYPPCCLLWAGPTHCQRHYEGLPGWEGAGSHSPPQGCWPPLGLPASRT